jgi:hypothetical protein
MNADDLPEIEKNGMLPPVKLTLQQEDLCKRLDLLNQKTIQGQELSKMFRGAIYAIRKEYRSNPDWMAQSAHSLREIIYQFSPKHSKIRLVDALKMFGSVTTENDQFIEKMGRVRNRIESLAHHRSELTIEEYEKLIEEYEMVLMRALERQVDIHKEIDRFLSEVELG